MHAEADIGLHVTCPMLSNFYQNYNVVTNEYSSGMVLGKCVVSISLGKKENLSNFIKTHLMVFMLL
jgi:hypothetical protein